MSEITTIKPLKYWVQKVLPLVYDDSLSYYELLNKVVLKLNQLIVNNDNLPEYIREQIADMITPESIEEILSEIFDTLRHNIAELDDGESTTATADRNKGDWIWLNDNLYEVLRNLNAGDAYVFSGSNPNVAKISVEDMVDAVANNLSEVEDTLKHNIAEQDDGNSATATADRAEGSWIWLNNELYKVLRDINSGDAYIISGTNPNLLKVTVEDMVDAELSDVYTLIENLTTLVNSIKHNIASFDEGDSAVATENVTKGQLIWINDDLYEANKNIVYGTPYVFEGENKNVDKVTVEELLGNIINDINNLNTKTSWFVSSFDGETPADKLQNAINYGVAHYSGDVVVDIDVDLTGTTIKINKGIIYSDDAFIRLRSKLTIMGINGAKITKDDSGFFFSTDLERAGDITFKDLIFRGNVILGGANDIQARKDGNSVFDGKKFIRICTINNSYTLVGAVFDNRGATDTVMQSNYSFGDVCTYSNCYYYVHRCYDIKISHATIEQCNYGIAGYAEENHPEFINDFAISDSVIEGSFYNAIALSSAMTDSSINGFSCINCYFEENDITRQVYTHIALGVVELKGAIIQGCRFAYSHANEIGVVAYANYDGLIIIGNRVSANANGLNGRLAYLTRTATGAIHRAIFINNVIMSGNAVIVNDESLAVNVMTEGIHQFYSSPILAGYSDANDVRKLCSIRTSGSPNNMTNTPITSGILYTISQNHGVANTIQWFFADIGVIYCRFKTSGLAWTNWKTIAS